MDESSQDGFNIEIAEIERLVKKFKERFAAGTTSADDFMTISELELLSSGQNFIKLKCIMDPKNRTKI